MSEYWFKIILCIYDRLNSQYFFWFNKIRCLIEFEYWLVYRQPINLISMYGIA